MRRQYGSLEADRHCIPGESSMRSLVIPAVLATALCASTQAAATDKPNSPPPVPKMFQVFQKNLNFHPTELILKAGDSVTWTNKESDDTTHSVVQGNGSDIDSPDIQPGETFVWKFDHPGRWDIVCRFHPDMFMTIGVADKDGKVPPETPFVPSTPTLPANPTPSHGTVPGVTGLPIAHHRPAQRTY
jgi:plastocyanin